jgi:uncharacterized membrane protein YcaP (DUF421 family)
MSILELILRLALAFITLLVLTRIIGRKELSQMTFFNFVSGISIGTIGASLAIDSNLTVLNGIVALLGWIAFTIALGYLDIKSKNARLLIEGSPRILIKKGRIMENELRKARLDVDALTSLLRGKNVFSITDVDYAIFEPDGNLSVMKKEAKQPVTRSDMKINNKSAIIPLPANVVSDGQIVTSNLNELNLSEKWLNQQLQSAGVHSVSNVMYAEIQKDGSLYIDLKDDY